MPITKSAIKKLRADKKRTLVNRPVKAKMKTAIKVARSEKKAESVRAMYSALDKAVKSKITTKNTAARIKARLAASMKLAQADNPFAGKKKSEKQAPSK